MEYRPSMNVLMINEVAQTIIEYTLPETNIAPYKWMVGTLLSFWEGLFSGILVSGRIQQIDLFPPFQPRATFPQTCAFVHWCDGNPQLFP